MDEKSVKGGKKRVNDLLKVVLHIALSFFTIGAHSTLNTETST
jgi:hypothetical protein